MSAASARRTCAAAWSRWGHDPAEVEVWVDAFHFIQLLRLRRQREQLRRHEEPDNRIDPDQLNEIERRALKDAIRQARKLQSGFVRAYAAGIAAGAVVLLAYFLNRVAS